MIGKKVEILTSAMGQRGAEGKIVDSHVYMNGYGEYRMEYLVEAVGLSGELEKHWYRENELAICDDEESLDDLECCFIKYGEGYIEMKRKNRRKFVRIVIAIAIITAFWIGFGIGINS